MGKMLISLLFLFWLLDQILIKVVTNPLSKKCVEFSLNQVALLELSFLISFESELLCTQEKKVVYWLESWLIAITLQWFLHFKVYFKEGSCLRRVWWVLSFCICLSAYWIKMYEMNWLHHFPVIQKKRVTQRKIFYSTFCAECYLFYNQLTILGLDQFCTTRGWENCFL